MLIELLNFNFSTLQNVLNRVINFSCIFNNDIVQNNSLISIRICYKSSIYALNIR